LNWSVIFNVDANSKNVFKVVSFNAFNLDLPINHLVPGYFWHCSISQRLPNADLPPPAAPKITPSYFISEGVIVRHILPL
jgi:hypothetical protein